MCVCVELHPSGYGEDLWEMNGHWAEWGIGSPCLKQGWDRSLSSEIAPCLKVMVCVVLRLC